ncbi:hypothetical protein [Raoultibacter phocaeensis]|uniref:hypothetical protein n=1 Tax=Raoultibacter phocaeensis TaxID=2479841 RepID=UPI00111B33DB|nr:hypothetical protein [Raoultibacter phocaeensis]
MPKKSPRYAAVQAYLRSVLANERRIQYLECEIEKQQSRLALNGIEGGESVRRTMAGDALEQGFIKLYELCDSMDTELIGYVEEREKARAVLSHIAGSKGYEVLYLRYFEGMRFKDIYRRIFISEDYMYELHRTAMTELYPYMPAEFKLRDRRLSNPVKPSET